MIEQLANAMMIHDIPEYIRSDDVSEFIAKKLRSWLSCIGVKTASGRMAYVKALTAPSETTF